MAEQPPETPPTPESRSPLAEQTDERSARADWRSSAVGSIGITLLFGVWLAASPLAFSYEHPGGAIIWGALIVVLSLLRLMTAGRSVTLGVVTVIAGALTAASALVLSETPGATANLLLVGLIVAVLALIGLGAGEESGRASRP